MSKGKWFQFGISIIVVFVLNGCGGGGGGTSTLASTITGTAATGAPIVGQVVAIDSSNPAHTYSATTNAATGAYTVNVAGGTHRFF